MDLSQPAPRRMSEPALPMINVVFLLLIFFLMSAQITPPPPVDVALPTAEAQPVSPEDIAVYLSARGDFLFGDLRAEEAWEALLAMSKPDEIQVLIKADASAAATDLAKVMARLTSLGFSDLQLATEGT